MNDEAAFLAAIRAEPGDDTVRLVFADWLDERGESERAEFLRLQHQLTTVLNRLDDVRAVLDPEWARATEIRRPVGVDSRLHESGITEIELHRFRGFGPCPDFRFTARSDGRYTYEGRCHVTPLGERSGRFPPYLFARLVQLCSDLDVLGLADDYPTNFDDAPIMLLVVRYAGGVKSVRNEAGDVCPPRLWGFALLIECAMRQAFQTEDR